MMDSQPAPNGMSKHGFHQVIGHSYFAYFQLYRLIFEEKEAKI